MSLKLELETYLKYTNYMDKLCVPEIQMTLVAFDWKKAYVLGGLTFKIEVVWVPGIGALRSGRPPVTVFLGGSGDGAGPREVLRWRFGSTRSEKAEKLQTSVLSSKK